MAENQLLFGLKRQYGKTLGLIEAGEDRAEDLAHLAAVIRMFKPAEDLSEIAPIRPYPENRDRWNRDALAILRRENAPMTARALARRILAARGVPLTRRNLQRVECSLHAVLGRLEGRGVVRETTQPKRWAIAG
jgi:hypothetical protein